MTPENINQACQALAAADDDLAAALSVVGPPAPRNRPAGFETLFATIVSQQLSTHAAAAIMGRVRDLIGESSPDLNHRAVLDTEDEKLRAAGLSYRKIEYAKGLAAAIEEGRFDVNGLSQLADEQAIEQIVSLRGFGRWSAEIYLMFSLRREDVFPADDLALQVALGRLKGLDRRPTAKQARALVAHWQPWRTAGSLFLWHYYKGAPT